VRAHPLSDPDTDALHLCRPAVARFLQAQAAFVAPAVRFADVQTMGLLISDKQAGAFRIEVKDIATEAEASKAGT
jgi:hypothetical protein